MLNGFTHYYKMKVYVDNGMQRYETWKYVFADSENKAIKAVLHHYDSQYDTYARVIEIYNYPIQDVMIFNQLNDD